jgi:PAS domain S-box-containing protein
MSIADLEVNESAADAVAHNRKIMEQGGDRFVSRHRRKDGTVFDVEVSATFIPVDDGLIVGFQRDVTDRRRSEELLRYERDRAQGYLDTVETIIVALDAGGRITTINRKACQILGYAEDELLGRFWFETCLPQPAGMETVYPYFTGFMAGRQECAEYFENPVITRSGGIRHVAWHNAVLRDEQGRTSGTLSAGEDITDRKKAEKELLQAKTAAESASRTKSQFLANMSHEIRTPMNGIIGITQILEMTELTQEQKEYFDILKQSGNNLLKLISDILDLSRIEAGKVELETEHFDLKAEITGTASIFSLIAQGKGLEFSFHINPDVPLLLKGDAERLRQILTNLIGNAIKFTSQGDISLRISKDAEDGQHATLRFQVRDSGIGIGSDKIGTIFEAFSQADSSTSRKYGGTGLGLAIAHHLVEMMGGSVGVESVEGEGATFWFTAVLERQAEAPDFSVLEKVAAAGGINDISVRILLVEDDVTNQFAISRLLSKYGYQVDVAGDGSQGLKLLEESDYALVLMDCMMPVLDGYEATAAIRDRASKVRNHAVPVIALTANAMREDRDNCLAAGMDDYLSKPIVVPVLLAMLEKWSLPK